jgi:hypothetical protein
LVNCIISLNSMPRAGCLPHNCCLYPYGPLRMRIRNVPAKEGARPQAEMKHGVQVLGRAGPAALAGQW